MRYIKREPAALNNESEKLFKRWEWNFMLTIIIILVMATILDLKIPLENVLKYMQY